MKTITDYEQASGLSCRSEEYACLKDTQLVFVDSQRFIDDYGCSPSKIPETAACHALLSVGSSISSPHTVDNPLHDPPSTTGASRIGYRPPRYGRVAIFDLVGTDFKGLLEVKGCGVASDKKPNLGGIRTGVLFMHEALTELINAVLLNRLFARDGVNLSTVPFYAILNTGLRANVRWASVGMPCASLLRKPLIRPPDHIELPLSGSEEEAIHQRIEHYLLSRGLTTTGPITTVTIAREGPTYVARLDGQPMRQMTEEIIYWQLHTLGLQPPQIFHFANIQIARHASLDPLEACLIDLGHVRACDDLPGHLAVFVDDKPLNWGVTTFKGGADWPTRCKHKPIDYNVFGPQLISDKGMSEQLYNWLRPTESFQKVSSGVVWEAIRLTMLIDNGECSPDQLTDEIEHFVDRVCPT